MSVPKMSNIVPSVEDWVLVGKLGAPNGVQGALRFLSYTDPVDQFLSYPCYLRESAVVLVPLTIIKSRKHFDRWIVWLDQVLDRSEAALYTGKEVYTFSSSLSELASGEYYWRDLIGMQAINLQEEVLGTVSELMETGANDVLVLSGAGKRILLPYVPSVVLKVECERKRIIVDWHRDF